MAITIKRINDLERAYREPVDQQSTIQAADGVKLHLVAARRKEYWHGRGLVPVHKDSGMVVNPELYQTTAEGTLRIGDLEVWAEHVEHLSGRQGALQRKREKFSERLVEAQQGLQEEAARVGLAVNNAYDGGSSLESTMIPVQGDEKSPAKKGKSSPPVEQSAVSVAPEAIFDQT
jgi:hypothetical protein